MAVIDFTKAKAELDPHISGDARCLACQHEWVAIAPIGTIWLECPACSLDRGRYIAQALRDGDHWHCACGCDLFYVTDAGVYCPNCGAWQDFDH